MGTAIWGDKMHKGWLSILVNDYLKRANGCRWKCPTYKSLTSTISIDYGLQVGNTLNASCSTIQCAQQSHNQQIKRKSLFVHWENSLNNAWRNHSKHTTYSISQCRTKCANNRMKPNKEECQKFQWVFLVVRERSRIVSNVGPAIFALSIRHV